MPTSIDLFLKSIQKTEEVKTLTKEQEVELGTLIQNKDISEKIRLEAVNTLVIKNVYLVLKLVHKYKRSSFDLEDLVGYGILGLFSAARKYDPKRANRFASYARHWIKESIMKAVREYGDVPKIPVYLVKNLWKVTRVVSKNETISNVDLAKKTSLDEVTVQYLRSLVFKSVQFNPEYTEVDRTTPEQIYAKKEYCEILQEALDTLTKLEQTVLMYVFELNNYPKMTLVAIEAEFGIKNARILKASALAKLRKNKKLHLLCKEY